MLSSSTSTIRYRGIKTKERREDEGPSLFLLAFLAQRAQPSATDSHTADRAKNDVKNKYYYLCPGEGAEDSFLCSVNEKKRGPPIRGAPIKCGKTSQLGASQYVIHPRAAQMGDASYSGDRVGPPCAPGKKWT